METHDPEILKKVAEIAHNEALDQAAKTKGSLYAPKENIPKKFQKYRMMDAGDYATYACKCRESHNRNIKYLGLVRANGQAVGGAMYYLTIRAIDDIDGKEKNFRAKVWLHVGGKFSLEGFKKEPKMKHSTPKRPFNIFVAELRKSSEFANTSYKDVLSIASDRWRDMSAQDKEPYIQN